jgi:hypothetical protein
MLMLLMNMLILAAAAAIVCVAAQGENNKVSYTHQIKRAGELLVNFASLPEDSKSQTTLLLWGGGSIVCLLLMSELIGVVAAVFAGAIIGNWISKEPTPVSTSTTAL